MEENKKVFSEELSEEKVVSDVTEQIENVDEDLRGENLHDRVKVLSPGQMVMKRFFRSKLSMIGLVTLIVLFLFSFIGPMFSPWSANDGKVADKNPDNIKMSITTEEIEFIGPDGNVYIAYEIIEELPDRNSKGDITWEHLLGTDENGWDIFTRLMLGGRISLTIGFVVIFLEAIIGVILGGIARYFGG